MRVQEDQWTKALATVAGAGGKKEGKRPGKKNGIKQSKKTPALEIAFEKRKEFRSFRERGGRGVCGHRIHVGERN